MRNQILLFLFFSFSLPAYSQFGTPGAWYYGIHFSPNLMDIHMREKDYPGLSPSINQQYKPMPGYSAGFVLGRNISAKLSIETGLSVLMFAYGFSQVPRMNDTLSQQYSRMRVRNYDHFLEMPIRLNGYFPGEKRNFCVSAGFYSSVLLHTSSYIKMDYTAGGSYKTNSGSFAQSLVYHLDPTLGAGMFFPVKTSALRVMLSGRMGIYSSTASSSGLKTTKRGLSLDCTWFF